MTDDEKRAYLSEKYESAKKRWDEREFPMQVTVGSVTFKTKKSLEDHVRSIVAKYDDGCEITDRSDFEFVFDLLMLHHEAPQKLGRGIIRFTIERDTVWHKTRHFQIHRSDGTTTDFSWRTCIDGHKRHSDVLGAIRRAISDEVIQFKTNALSRRIVCPVTGVELTRDNSHVDHQRPMTFNLIACQWMFEIGGSDKVIISEPTDNQLCSEMTDFEQRKSWIETHNKLAVFRLISAEANLRARKF